MRIESCSTFQNILTNIPSVRAALLLGKKYTEEAFKTRSRRVLLLAKKIEKYPATYAAPRDVLFETLAAKRFRKRTGKLN